MEPRRATYLKHGDTNEEAAGLYRSCGGNSGVITEIAVASSVIGALSRPLTHLARSVALQLKHVHGVVDPPTVMIELDVPRQALDTHLGVTTGGILGTA